MPSIVLSCTDPLVLRAKALQAKTYTEVGFIPGDKYGCKIYARSQGGKVSLLGMHSPSYGCRKVDPEIVVVR